MRCCHDPLQFLARAPAGCLAGIRRAVRKHVLGKPGPERYSIMLEMHLAMTEVRVGLTQDLQCVQSSTGCLLDSAQCFAKQTG